MTMFRIAGRMQRMQINVTFTAVPDAATLALLTEILARVKLLTREVRAESQAMSKELDDLTAQVQRNGDVEASAVTLIQGIAQQLKDAQNDPAAVAALAASLGAQADALAAAVAANTPAAPQA